MRALMKHMIFLRSFLRARVFVGTLAAGGGSCQVAFTGYGRTKHSVMYGSIPVGNRTPFFAREEDGT